MCISGTPVTRDEQCPPTQDKPVSYKKTRLPWHTASIVTAVYVGSDPHRTALTIACVACCVTHFKARVQIH